MRDTSRTALRAQLAALAEPNPPIRLLVPPAPPDDWWSEAQFQTVIIDLAHVCGWETYHTLNSRGSDAGWPDLVLAREDGTGKAVVLLREVKTKRGVVRPEQRRWGRMLLAAGLDWAIWRPADWGLIVATLAGDEAQEGV